MTCGVTEGEYDCMALFQATRLACVSLPNGASSLPSQMISTLKRCPRVVLWMDFDELGQLNLEVFAKKFGLLKTHLVKEKEIQEILDFIRHDETKLLRFIGKKWIAKFEEIADQQDAQDMERDNKEESGNTSEENGFYNFVEQPRVISISNLKIAFT